MDRHMQFKTNINCSNCIRAVTGFIEEVPGIASWQVDTSSPDKILTVEGETVTPEAVVAAVQEAGFDIALITGSISA